MVLYLCHSVHDTLSNFSTPVRVENLLGAGSLVTYTESLMIRPSVYLLWKPRHRKLGILRTSPEKRERRKLSTCLMTGEGCAEIQEPFILLILCFHEAFDALGERCLLMEHCSISIHDLSRKEQMFPLPGKHVQQIFLQLVNGQACEWDRTWRLVGSDCYRAPKFILRKSAIFGLENTVANPFPLYAKRSWMGTFRHLTDRLRNPTSGQ